MKSVLLLTLESMDRLEKLAVITKTDIQLKHEEFTWLMGGIHKQRQILNSIEWAIHSGENGSTLSCPYCGCVSTEGHVSGCLIKDALEWFK